MPLYDVPLVVHLKIKQGSRIMAHDQKKNSQRLKRHVLLIIGTAFLAAGFAEFYASTTATPNAVAKFGRQAEQPGHLR